MWPKASFESGSVVAADAVQRGVAEVNTARSDVGLPILIPNRANEIVVSVFDERHARGPGGRSIYPATSNQEAFLATFASDSAGGFEVLFLIRR